MSLRPVSVWRIAISLMVLFLAPPVSAYNFLYIHPTTGKPIGWEAGTTIKYYLDPGKLGRLTNDQAHTLIKEAMKIWQNASPHANVPKFEFAGLLPEDVDGTNYKKYVSLFTCYTDDLSSCKSDSQKNLETVIIFDEDNSILDNELCRITTCSANAGAHVFQGSSSDPSFIRQGVFVLGKTWGEKTSKISAVTGTTVHELGHLLGLAHTSINQEAYIDSLDGWDRYAPTMFFSVPGVVADQEKTRSMLNPDDIVGISTLYPSDSFTSETAMISGKITKSDGSAMMHVNVVARNVDDPLCEVYSFLSGRLCEHTTIGEYCLSDDGNFLISGLPAGSYTIEVEEVTDNNLGKTLAPGLLPSEDIFGDAEFWNENDTANESNTLSTTIELSSGETMENVDIVLNRSEVTDDRIKYIPLSTFTAGSGTECPEKPTTDYAALIGIDESGGSSTTEESTASNLAGCALIPDR